MVGADYTRVMKAFRSIHLLLVKLLILALLADLELFCHADPLGSWTLVFSNTPTTLTGMAYGNGTFVGVGGGLDYISHDGSNWTAYANPPFLNETAVAYGNGLFVSYETGLDDQPSYISTSTDGIHWATIYTNYWPILNAAYGNNSWVFTAWTTNGGKIFTASVTSSNSNWSQVSQMIEYPESLGFLNGSFVMQLDFYYVDFYNGPFIFSSTDGITWQYKSIAPSSYGGEILFGHGNYLFSDSDEMWISPDLVNWSVSFTNSNLWISETQIGYFEDEFIGIFAVASSFTTSNIDYETLEFPICSSADGTTWQTDGFFTAFPIMTSTFVNGTVTNETESYSGAPFLVYGQGTFLTSTGNNIYQSGVFATNSTPTPTELSVSTYAGVTINGAVGAVYQIQFSTDLNTWQTITNFVLPYSPFIWVDTSTTVAGKRFYRSVQVQ